MAEQDKPNPLENFANEVQIGDAVMLHLNNGAPYVGTFSGDGQTTFKGRDGDEDTVRKIYCFNGRHSTVLSPEAMIYKENNGFCSNAMLQGPKDNSEQYDEMWKTIGGKVTGYEVLKKAEESTPQKA